MSNLKLRIRDKVMRWLRVHGTERLPGRTNDTDLYRELFGEEAVKNRRFCNISAGGFYGFGAGLNHPCWTNADYVRSWKAFSYRPSYPEYNPSRDIAYDALSGERLALEDNSMLLVYCRFALGHLSDQAAETMFSEIYRVLAPGGLLRIVTPDADLDYNAYMAGDRKFYYWDDPAKGSFEQAFLSHIALTASTRYPVSSNPKIDDEEFKRIIHSRPKNEALDYFVSRTDEECNRADRSIKRNWWNPEKTGRALSKAGFRDIRTTGRGQSLSPVFRNLRYFDTDVYWLMMYMEASK